MRGQVGVAVGVRVLGWCGWMCVLVVFSVGGGGGELEVPLCRVGVQDCLLSCFLFGWWGGLEVPVGCLFFFFFGWGGGGGGLGSGCCCLAFFYWGEGVGGCLFCSGRGRGLEVPVQAVPCGGSGSGCLFVSSAVRARVRLFFVGRGVPVHVRVCRFVSVRARVRMSFPRGSVGGSGSGSGSAICFFSMEGGSEVPVRVRHRLLMCDVVHVTGEKGAGAGPHVPTPMPILILCGPDLRGQLVGSGLGVLIDLYPLFQEAPGAANLLCASLDGDLAPIVLPGERRWGASKLFSSTEHLLLLVNNSIMEYPMDLSPIAPSTVGVQDGRAMFGPLAGDLDPILLAHGSWAWGSLVRVIDGLGVASSGTGFLRETKGRRSLKSASTLQPPPAPTFKESPRWMLLMATCIVFFVIGSRAQWIAASPSLMAS